MPLSPQARALLDMVYRVGAPRFHDLSVAQARHSFQKLQFAFRPEAPAVASVTEVPVPRPDGSVLLARLYRPLSAGPDEVLGLLVYFHGGGWCVGDVESYDVLCRELANGAGCAVLSVDYRLAPEHPFPAAVNDARLAFDWAAEHAGLLGIDPQRIALGGDSAGGNLSIVTALALRDADGCQPCFLLLVYPSTEILSERPSRQTYGDGYFLDRESLQWFFERYLPGGETEDWRASPMRAASLAGLPPMLLVTAECDPLTDDCLAFAERVRAEGGELTHLPVAGMVHGFLTLGKFFPEARDTVAAAAAALRRVLA
ncbi:alpha/beta hydrolase [Thauera sp. CAU 1555]|uniref:Alpha/beta hydrolase n=1 Tax=Thauera sedimentorum TaxID=2767595 RepID=A0ABR9B733_9RHOO|nr:alpha/beta hydrolase [Thauera sedimentorum]MBC9071261.1 alpha/beta hydrolase [Thauera sedimentorum]MBD8502180.1 alpha/beta hydrolase [Thauera sedimentorum]